jgi:hypothetical protein
LVSQNSDGWASEKHGSDSTAFYESSSNTDDFSSLPPSQTLMFQAQAVKDECDADFSGDERQQNEAKNNRNKFLRILRSMKYMMDDRDYAHAIQEVEEYVEMDKLLFTWVHYSEVRSVDICSDLAQLNRVFEALGLYVVLRCVVGPERLQRKLQLKAKRAGDRRIRYFL